jgi:hypothetical protein
MTDTDRTIAPARSLDGIGIINVLIATLSAACLLAVLAGAIFR